jgi:hypothetical protein
MWCVKECRVGEKNWSNFRCGISSKEKALEIARDQRLVGYIKTKVVRQTNK